MSNKPTKQNENQNEKRFDKQALINWLYHPTDLASLAVLRIIFGLLMTIRVVSEYMNGELVSQYFGQTYRYKFLYFGWLPNPSDEVLAIIFGVIAVSGLLISIGFLYRWATIAFAFSWTYVFLINQLTYQNHDYLICLLGFMLIFMPLNRIWSVDAIMSSDKQVETIPAWCLNLVRFQIGMVYFFGAIRKLNPDWLHGEPVRSMLHFVTFEHPKIAGVLFWEPLVPIFVYGGLLLDLLVVPALIWRPTRIPAFIVAVGFHLTNVFLWHIDIFPWFMIFATLMFFAPNYPRIIIGKFKKDIDSSDRTEQSIVQQEGTSRQRRGLACLSLFVAMQVLIPLRPFLYPRHPLEQPDLLYFSWNMMLLYKNSVVEFKVKDNDSQQEWDIVTDDFMPEEQRASFKTPDLIHQAALHVAAQKHSEGFENVSVYANALHSVHGRQWQYSVDPETDLAATPRMFGAKPWAMPFIEPNPPAPEKRTAYYRAEWQLLNDAGVLPLNGAELNEELAEKVRALQESHQNSVPK